MRRVVCTYCGSSWYIEDDHYRAAIRGGVSTVPSCRACNRSKRDKTPADWLDWLSENDRYRFRKIVQHQKGRRSPFAKLVRKRR